MTSRQRFSLGVAVAIAVLGLGLVAATVAAQAPVRGQFGTFDPAPGQEIRRVGEANVLDKVEYRAASDFAMRVTPFIRVDADGVPRLDADVTADQLGVDQKFLDDFVLALGFASDAINSGAIVVNDDLTVDVVGASPAAGALMSVAPIDSSGALDRAGGDDTVDWQSWRYNTGAMFYNSYPDYHNYYHNRYYVLCSSMAAQLGYPWMSTNLVYFYSYNAWYFSRHLNSSYGMYWFMPFSGSGCYQYNPCYCCGVSYRPIYIWVLTYQYYPSCGCHQPTWGWQGYWARY